MLLPSEKVFYFRFEAKTTRKHPYYETVGGAIVKAWIVALDLPAAEMFARHIVEEELGFQIINREIGMPVEAEQYTSGSTVLDPKDLEYYHQAVLDRHVTCAYNWSREADEALDD